MTFDLGQLDDFARSVAQALFATYPDWVNFARMELAEDGEKPDLVVEVPSPRSGQPGEQLGVYTEDSEVTISFASYHEHFDWPPTDTDRSMNPLTFIAAILNEDVAAVSGWNDDKWCGSWLIEKGEAIAQPKNMNPMKLIRVRSWKGTLDQDLRPI